LIEDEERIVAERWFSDLMAEGAIWLVPADRENGLAMLDRLRELAEAKWEAASWGDDPASAALAHRQPVPPEAAP
jgi:hypothetical protein